MKRVGFLLNGVLLAGVLTYLLAGSSVVASPLCDAELAELEAKVAATQDPDELAALASHYLDEQQPGLAQAVLDGAPQASSVRLSQTRARVAFAQGRVDDALASSRAAVDACEAEAATCPGHLYARAIHQTQVLAAMHEAGVQDPANDPQHARAIAARSMREVRLAGTF